MECLRGVVDLNLREIRQLHDLRKQLEELDNSFTIARISYLK